MKKILLLVAVMVMVVGAIFMFGCATTGTGVLTPLPRDINVETPSVGISEEIAKFSGAWQGKWDEVDIPISIVVEKITPAEVVAVYSWGGTSHRKAGFARVAGRVSGDSIVLKWGSNMTLTLSPSSIKNSVRAEFKKAGWINRATLSRAVVE